MSIEPEPVSVIMTDWGAGTEHISRHRNAMVYELMLLSLMYDPVLIQDEVLALSDKIAGWFSSDDGWDILSKCLDLGTIRILTHPQDAYNDDRLAELSIKNPLQARAEYISLYSSKEELPFVPSTRQEVLYRRLDAYLLEHTSVRRPVRSVERIDVPGTFGRILRQVLGARESSAWLQSAFAGISDKMAYEFLSYLESPDLALRDLTNAGFRPKTTGDRPIFNRSLGYQLTTLYTPRQAGAMKRLIQTAHAAPFCWNEDAMGRYSNVLRELLWSPEEPDLAYHGNEKIVSVEAHTEIPLQLPEIDSRFPEIIKQVRQSEAGRNLRDAMRSLGSDQDFQTQTDAWAAVAQETARVACPGPKVSLVATAVATGNRLISGAVIGGLWQASHLQPLDVVAPVVKGVLGGAIGLSSSHLYRLMQCYMKHERVRESIEKAVEFRCVDIPRLPGVVLPK